MLHSKSYKQNLVVFTEPSEDQIFLQKRENYISTDFVSMKMLLVNYQEFIIWNLKNHLELHSNRKQKEEVWRF